METANQTLPPSTTNVKQRPRGLKNQANEIHPDMANIPSTPVSACLFPTKKWDQWEERGTVISLPSARKAFAPRESKEQ